MTIVYLKNEILRGKNLNFGIGCSWNVMLRFCVKIITSIKIKQLI